MGTLKRSILLCPILAKPPTTLSSKGIVLFSIFAEVEAEYDLSQDDRTLVGQRCESPRLLQSPLSGDMSGWLLGTLALDITPPLAAKPRQDLEPILLVTHGLTGGSHESYVQVALQRLTAPTSSGGLSLRAVVLNSRGCNGTPVTSAKLYHVSSFPS